PTDSRRFAYLFFEVINEIGLCCLQRRAEAEKHCCNEAKEECHRKHRRVRTQFDDKRKIHERKQTAQLLEQKIVAPGTEDQADGAAANGKQKSFAQKFPDNLPASRADSQTDRDFPRAR